MLTHVCENYRAMQKHLSQLMNTDSERDPITQSRKRKAESENCTSMLGFSGRNNNISTHECSTSTEEESFKRPKDMIISPNKVSKVLVKTDASDNSLVSSQI